MKTIILILLAGLLAVSLIGCSNNSVALKKTGVIHQKSQIIDKKENDNHAIENNNHTSSIFKSTLSSFVPINTDSLDGSMPWQQMLKNYYMNSNMIYYILFAISFITIGLFIFISVRNKASFKKNNKFNA